MFWNTIKLTNKLEKQFVGRYGGVDIILEAGKERNLPSEVSKHLAFQLYEESKKNKDYNFSEPADFLGVEIETADNFNDLSLKEQIERHEQEFEIWQKQKEKEALTQINKVNDLLNV